MKKTCQRLLRVVTAILLAVSLTVIIGALFPMSFLVANTVTFCAAVVIAQGLRVVERQTS